MHYPSLLSRSMAACFTTWVALAPLPAAALSLGELMVSSHLGQPFRAQVGLRTSPDEAVDESCVSLSRPLGNSDSLPYLSRAKISIEGSGENQVIRLRTSQQVNDPVLKLFINITCGGQTSLSREFTLFLDPQDYAEATTLPEVPATAVKPAQQTKPQPSTNSVWTLQPGDSLDGIASTLYPHQPSKQRRITQAIIGANPQLFKDGMPAALPAGENLVIPALPPRVASVVKKAEPSIQETEEKPSARPGMEHKPHATAPAQESFQLKLSSGELDLSASQNMTEEERLKLREKQLLLEADDQVASILALKNRVKQLETQLNDLSLKMSGGVAEAAHPAALSKLVEKPSSTASSIMPGEGMRYFWLGLGGITLVLAAFFGLRRYQRKQQEAALAEQYLFSTALAADEEPSVAAAPVAQTKTVAEVTVPASEEPYYDPSSIFNPPDENITLTEVESVIEEADLYLIYGWTQKAVDLLQSHIDRHPEEIKPWFMLFDTLRTQGAKDAFERLARRFKETFTDPAEWHKVQALGREFDPKNSLYYADPAQAAQATQEVKAKEEPLDFWANANHDFTPNMQARISQTQSKSADETDKPLPNILDFERKEQRDK